MKAVVHHAYGSPDVLRFADVDTPSPGAGEVVVRTHAASVNARDWHLLRGDPYLARLLAPELGLRAPRQPIRGTDFAGTVEAVGSGVTRLRPGDEVFGESPGAFAEYVLAPADVVDVKPANLTFEQAAALPLAANTALMGLREADAQPGQSVLINGASGGVGTFATQLAAEFGADVTGVCSPRNAELVRSLGAGRVVDYTREDFTDQGRRYDVVFDLVGNRSLRALRRTLTPGGTLVLSGGGVSTGGSLVGPMALVIRGQAVARFVRQRIVVLTATPSHANLAALRELAEAGKLTPVIDRTYPLSAAADAIRYLETDHARAKVVLTA
ncbi:NAD(P)-dependent alcohol dehydrogenase [Cryptosporangium minutisporangium]|uniref:NAD(P)-dependent alcohol dehydrogenase n=1 Tax=Cryptosporangium minutisporangium TaxID=113569 RepID=A0ABP6SSW1_9ACTN